MVKPNSSTRKSKGPRSPAASDQETRERLLKAAHVVFLRKGTAGSRTQEIADEAGVNKALVHYYFGTKAALADAVFEQALATLLPIMWGILLDPDRSLEEKVPVIVRAQIEFQSSRPYFAGYLVSEMHAAPERIARLIAVRGPLPLDVLRKQLREEARAGRMRSMSAEQFVANMMGLLIFPFAVRPALCELLALDEAGWRAFLAERLRILPGFVLAGLRP
jgi:TetR/AcrR family transcriptional regulator